MKFLLVLIKTQTQRGVQYSSLSLGISDLNQISQRLLALLSRKGGSTHCYNLSGVAQKKEKKILHTSICVYMCVCALRVKEKSEKKKCEGRREAD